MSGPCLCFMELYTKYKPHMAIQNHFKKNKQTLRVGSPKEDQQEPYGTGEARLISTTKSEIEQKVME